MTKTEGSILKIKLGGKDKENSGGKEGGTVKGNKKEKFRDVAEEKRGGNRKILMEEN